MRKLLLLSAAVLLSSAASAQLTSKASNTNVKAAGQHKALPQATFKKQEAVAAKQVGKPVFSGLSQQKRFTISESQKQSLKRSSAVTRLNAPRRAGQVQELYNASGVYMEYNTPVQWEMMSSTAEDGTLLLADLIPDSIWGEGGVALPYTLEGNTITIEPQKVASSDDFNLYFFDFNTDDGVLYLTLGEDGSLSYSGSDLMLGYGAFSGDFDPTLDTYLGYFELVSHIDYRKPGDAPKTPLTSFEAANTVLFAGLGASGYSYNNNLAMFSPYAPVKFHNTTMDVATRWSWTATEMYEEETQLTASTVDFTINTLGGAQYGNIALVGENSGSVADTVKFGAGHPDKDGAVQYEAFYAYAGDTGDSFTFSDGTQATMSVLNPDCDLTFYTNFATPDKASDSMSKIYCYQGKPAAPLYIEGFNLPVVGYEQLTKFQLTLKVYKCHNLGNGKLELGDLIAQSRANSKSVDQTYAEQSGLTVINFNQLAVEDETGMTQNIDYLFIDDEFVVVIEGWDNGTFSAVLGCESEPYANKTISTWFELTEEPGSMYRYTSWPTSLWVGINGAAMGYLHTTDNTNLVIDNNGGQASIHVDPMLYSTDSETEEPTYRLFIESITVDGEEVEDLPEWLTISIANEDYSTDADGRFINGIDYDLVFQATAIPEDVTDRNCEITFMQEGAQLTVKVAQGENAGVEGVKTTVVNNGRIYNLAGRQARSGKGIMVRDGKKFIVK
ncbi:MAG: hypothetical protein K5928_08725 [Prevotella sp.]|nr:hypothetical protein [Prevotella sp.]